MKAPVITGLCLTAILLARPCRAADTNADKTITKSFTVTPGGELTVDADQGDIQVLTGDKDTVEIVVERDAPGVSASQAATALKQNKVNFSQDGNKVGVEGVTAKASHGWFSRPRAKLTIHFRITVPRRFDASLETGGGNIDVSDLNGTVDARSSGGSVTVSKIQGAVDAHTSGGNVKATGCSDKLELQTSGGDIAIDDFTGPRASADTTGGNINVAGCSGGLTVRTSGGNIGITGFTGAAAYADTSGGSVSMEFDSQPTGDTYLRTSGGNVTAKVPATITLDLVASATGGSVTSAIPVTVEGKQSEGTLNGKINGGGPKLVLHTSGGEIKVEKE